MFISMIYCTYIHTLSIITTLQSGIGPSFSQYLYLCVLILYSRHDTRHLQFKAYSEWQDFEKLYTPNIIYLFIFLTEICWKEFAKKIYKFRFIELVWPKPTYYLLEYDNFNDWIYIEIVLVTAFLLVLLFTSSLIYVL